ncbi:MAG: glycosyltransferase [Pedosphaera sp.]|nr:glycosyltransferase [Pedosphaera sp.]
MSYAPYRSDSSSSERSNSAKQHFLTRVKDSKTSDRIPRKKGTPRAKAKALFRSDNYPIIVHCHLCWDWVWQRPQQFLSRLSQRHPILFVETMGPDPQLVTPSVRILPTPDYPNITRVRLQFPAWRWGQSVYVDRTRRRVIQEALLGPLAGQFEDAVQWFYDPMTVTAFAGHLGEIATVYDCMDELSKFSEAHPELARREAELLARADVVFTGGRKLYEAKSRHNANCHFYGCGVDVDHFGRARDVETLVPAGVKNLGPHVLGYFGVIDERIDYELLAKLADANPQWSVAMIGPVIKVREHALPKRPNLHWLGQRPYAELPAYTKAFDVCLMPFALNEATEYINPTKALEYMATGKNVVSSAVSDVVHNFGSVVKVARSHNAFILLCRQAIAGADASAIKRGLKMAADNSWDSIVEKMEAHIDDALARKRAATVKGGGKR